jgi:solute carrier family 1 (glial high affinity glutamate transporter), member 3
VDIFHATPWSHPFLSQKDFQFSNELFCKILIYIILPNRISPIGVFFLVAAKILEIGSFEEVVGQLGWYFVTVMIGLGLHGFGTTSFYIYIIFFNHKYFLCNLGTICIIFFVTTRKLPFPYIAQMGQVLATAFGTGSR